MKINLLLDSGQVAHITIKSEWEDDIYDSLLGAIVDGTTFNEDGWDGTEIVCGGQTLDVLNCKKVVGYCYK